MIIQIMVPYLAQDPKIAFGTKLKQLRLAAKLSQEELASRAGIDRTYVSSCERGRRNISLQTIYRLAAALGVEPAAMLTPASSLPNQDANP